jgi:hypothetical protein
MNTFLLYKSDKLNKKYVMIMPKFGHKHYFGASAYRDFTLMNDKNSKFYEPSEEERNKVKDRYLKRHAKDPKGVHSPSTLSDMILWNKPTIEQGVKDYEKKYNVKVKIMNEKFKK